MKPTVTRYLAASYLDVQLTPKDVAALQYSLVTLETMVKVGGAAKVGIHSKDIVDALFSLKEVVERIGDDGRICLGRVKGGLTR